MKKAEKKPVDANAWMATYSDMVTLLMAFFVVLLSMSNTDEQKFNAFINSFSNMPMVEVDNLVVGNTEDFLINESDEGAEGDEDARELDEVYELLKQHVVDSGQEDSIIVSQFNDVVYIRFNSSLFFEPDKYVLKNDSLPTLSFIGQALVDYQNIISAVNILGFTATIDTGGTYWMLSGERAATVATYFNFTSGLPSDKIVVLGYGNRFPVADNDTAEGREQNRRVEIIIVGTQAAEDFNINSLLEAYHNGTADELYGVGSDNAFTDTNIGDIGDIGDVSADIGDVSVDVGDVSVDAGNVEISDSVVVE